MASETVSTVGAFASKTLDARQFHADGGMLVVPYSLS
jgi:hypothetical protein